MWPSGQPSICTRFSSIGGSGTTGGGSIVVVSLGGCSVVDTGGGSNVTVYSERGLDVVVVVEVVDTSDVVDTVSVLQSVMASHRMSGTLSI